jgi:hypothetical protein
MAKTGELSIIETAAGAGTIVVQAGAVLITMNPASVAVVAGAVAVVAIGSGIAYAISTRGKSVKFKVGDVFDVEAEFH